MAIIRLHKDPLNPLKHGAIHVGAVNLLDWLEDNAPWADIVSLNGSQIDLNESNRELCEFDQIDVYAVPQGIETALIYAAITIGTALIATQLLPKPEAPNNQGDRNTSPNAQLNAANNEFRPRQAIPYIYGEVKAWPDFLQPSYYTYDIKGNRQFVEWFVVGYGYHDITQIKVGDSLVADIPDSSATVYQPNEHPATFLNVRQADGSQDLELPPTGSVAPSVSVENGVIDASASTLTVTEAVIDALNLAVNDTLRLSLNWVDINGTERSVNADYNVDSFTATSVTVSGGSPFLEDSQGANVFGSAQNKSNIVEPQWFPLEGDAIEKIFFNLVVTNGIRTGTGGEGTIEFTVEAEELVGGVPNGNVVKVISTFVGDTQERLAKTVTLCADTGLTVGSWRARAYRNGSYISNNSVDNLLLENISGVESYSSANFKPVTLLQVLRSSSQQSASGSDKVNCIAQRLLPIFDPNTATFGARAATRSFAQAAMDLHVNLDGGTLAEIDYEQLFSISDNLSDPQLGYFDYTFSDKDIDTNKAMESILNAARCYNYVIGSRLSFERDQLQPTRSMVFNQRNIMPESLKQSYTPYQEQEFDSVELKYVDPVTNAEAYVRRRINPTTAAIETGLGDYVNEITLTGCRNSVQAINRAELEIRKIKYLWQQATFTATSEALTVGLGKKVGVVDVLDSQMFGGEILEDLGGDVYRLSEEWTPEAGQTYYAYAVQPDGTVSEPAIATQPAGQPKQMQVAGLSVVIADGYEVQQGSLYVISKLDNLKKRDYIVTARGKPDENYNLQVSVVNSDDNVYEMDA